jgi:putative membrane protein
MIGLPIALYIWSEPALSWGVPASVLLQTGLVLVILFQAWGFWQTIGAASMIVLITWTAEATGTATGFPFGAYQYTAKLQPQLAHVPLLIPLAWLMMLPAAWVVAAQITGRWSGLAFIGWSALALTAWDLFLDPQMVVWGFWTWTEPGGYFGIPWINFMGWLLTAALITFIVRPKPLPIRPLLILYTITWFLESFGLLFFWGLPGPALVGCLTMGGLLWLAWRNQHAKRRQL